MTYTTFKSRSPRLFVFASPYRVPVCGLLGWYQPPFKLRCELSSQTKHRDRGTIIASQPAHLTQSSTPPHLNSPKRRPHRTPTLPNFRRYHRRLRDHYFAQAVTIFQVPHPLFKFPPRRPHPGGTPPILSWYHRPASCTLICSNDL